jgi:hypothetical protein
MHSATFGDTRLITRTSVHCLEVPVIDGIEHKWENSSLPVQNIVIVEQSLCLLSKLEYKLISFNNKLFLPWFRSLQVNNSIVFEGFIHFMLTV